MEDLTDIQGLEARLLGPLHRDAQDLGQSVTIERMVNPQMLPMPAIAQFRPQLSLERATNAIAPSFIAAIDADKGGYTLV